jgi:hypothetical protein
MSSFHELKIIPAPDSGTRTVIDIEAPGEATMAGTDAAVGDLYCGQCGALMVTGMPKRNVKNSVIRCKLCRAYNDPAGIH